jgi:hypothetical protein
MTFPAASFATVPPPVDGLTLAFTAARRRRNSKATVTALGGVVAIAAALSFLAPPGQTLVQEPLPPAHTTLVPRVVPPEQELLPTALIRLPGAADLAVPAAGGVPTTTRPGAGVATAPIRRTTALTPGSRCPEGRRLACAVVGTPRAGGTSIRASVCPSAVAVTVESTPPVSDPTAVPRSRSITVATGRCDA